MEVIDFGLDELAKPADTQPHFMNNVKAAVSANFGGIVNPFIRGIQFVPTAVTLWGYLSLGLIALTVIHIRLAPLPTKGIDPRMQEYIGEVVTYCSGAVPWDTSVTCESSTEQLAGYSVGYFPLLKSIGNRMGDRQQKEQAISQAEKAGLQ